MPSYNDSISRIAAISLERCNRWHPKGINSWSLSDWGIAFGGEVGELFNVVKKLNRVRDGMVGNKASESPEALRESLGKEIADCYLYLDLLAQSEGINLAEVVREKFNETSVRNGFPEKL